MRVTWPRPGYSVRTANLAIFPDEDAVASIVFNADDAAPPPGQPSLVPNQPGMIVLASLYLPPRAAVRDR